MRFYVIKDGRCVSDYDNEKAAQEHANQINGEVAQLVGDRKKVKEVTLAVEDLKLIEKYLTEKCGLDTLDIMELLTEIERIKNVTIDF